MSVQLEQALSNLLNVLQDETHEHCVLVSVVFNVQGYKIEYKTRSPESLRRDGISMRNLRGEWVK